MSVLRIGPAAAGGEGRFVSIEASVGAAHRHGTVQHSVWITADVLQEAGERPSGQRSQSRRCRPPRPGPGAASRLRVPDQRGLPAALRQPMTMGYRACASRCPSRGLNARFSRHDRDSDAGGVGVGAVDSAERSAVARQTGSGVIRSTEASKSRPDSCSGSHTPSCGADFLPESPSGDSEQRKHRHAQDQQHNSSCETRKELPSRRRGPVTCANSTNEHPSQHCSV